MSRPITDYHQAISAALAAHDVKAVPQILILMALDGYGHEAEQPPPRRTDPCTNRSSPSPGT